MLNRAGPKTEPCDTPQIKPTQELNVVLTLNFSFPVLNNIEIKINLIASLLNPYI